MADAKEKLARAITAKFTQIMNNPREIEKVVRQAASTIERQKISKRFFEDTYKKLYTPTELDTRPFLNIGPGSFRHVHWRTSDKKYDGEAWTKMRRGIEQPEVDYDWDLYSRKGMPEADNFFKVIYLSHVIEHLFPEDVDHMLSEIRRLLEPHGLVRIVCPDAHLMATAYTNEDWMFFFHYLSVKTQRYDFPIPDQDLRERCARFLLDWVSLAVNEGNPQQVPKGQASAFIEKHSDIYSALDAAAAMSSREVNMKIGAHVSWYTPQKLMSLLTKAGFTQVTVSRHLQSQEPILRDPVYFDRTDPEMSMFVEARR
ncbi:class I SAM-dependent methyltransferase [Rhizobium sp. Rhizsp82]|uniref:class I SAM-dependent methyltransferase n=1 Tax=Rhizobium sp. Rhizsp82 TaxID=3243057 RepID=UPI0039B3C385